MSVYVLTERTFIIESESYVGPPPLRWEPAKGERLVNAHVHRLYSVAELPRWRWALIIETISA